MFFDDLNGILAHVGALKSYVGYISDELPCFSSNSVFSQLDDEKLYFQKISLKMEQGATLQDLIRNRCIKNIEEYSEFVNQLTKRIGANLSQQPLLLVTKENEKMEEERKSLAKMFFEKYQSPCLYFAHEAVTSLFVNGNYNGLIVDSGSYQTSLFPIHDGFLIKKSSLFLDMAGE